MISRNTARILGEVYSAFFSSLTRNHYRIVERDDLYDFLFENDYEAWFCNKVKAILSTRDTKEFIMKLHTGETQYKATPEWTWEARQKLGQKYLEDLLEDFLIKYDGLDDYYKGKLKYAINELKPSFELDGYEYKNKRLYKPEMNAVDVQEAQGVLEFLYTDLGLGNKETVLHHLKLSEEHYLNGLWDDCISNSRKFLECVAQEAAEKHSFVLRNQSLSSQVQGKPVEIRKYLEREGLLETKEVEALAKIYGLLSHTGGHPYMAENDQARLLRNMALTFSQFILIRLKGCLKTP